VLALIIIFILFTWMVCAAVCIGAGSLLLRGLRTAFSPLDAFWAGLALIAAILEIYHLLRPIDLFADYFLFVLGLSGWLAHRHSLFEHLGSLRKSHGTSLLLYATAVVFIAFRAAAPCEHYDTGFYGGEAIRWITTYRVVPGLGNLLPQLGYNSSIHLWMAALGQGPWRGLAHHFFASFMIAGLFAHVIPAGMRVLSGNEVSASDWFLTLLFFPAGIWASTGKISGADTDLPTSVVCLVAAAMYFRAVETRDSGLAGENSGLVSLVLTMLLFSLAVVFKLTILVLACLGWGLAAWRLWSWRQENPRARGLLIASALLCVVVVLPWIGRGLMLTGYPLFPSTVLSIPVDWKVPGPSVEHEADSDRSFARIPAVPNVDTSGFRWLRRWLREAMMYREGFVIPILLSFAGIALCIFGGEARKRSAPQPWLWLLLPSVCGLVFWFFEAPAIRFGEAAMWTTGATLGALAALRLLNEAARRRFAIVGVLLLTGWAAHPRLIWGSHIRPSLGVRTLLPLPQAKLTARQTASGLTVHVPVETNQCWDAPLPCSRFFNDTLRLRRSGDLGGGFASEGFPVDVLVPQK